MFGNAYNMINDEGKKREIKTFYARNSYSCIDHIYYTNTMVKCVSCMETVPEWLKEDESLECPNDKLVSDHLPIAALFEFRA